MKKLILLSFLLLILSYSHAQLTKVEVEVELDTDSISLDHSFSCAKLIDLRNSKDTFGLVIRGITPAQIILKKDSKNFQETIYELLPNGTNKASLVLIVRNLIVSEYIGTMTQIGYCNIEIEFAKKVDTTLFSLGTFYGNISEKNNTVKYTHGKRIIMALKNCFNNFEQSEWKNKKGTLIKKINEEKLLDYKTPPLKGAYFNYEQLKRNSPFETEDFEIKVAFQSKKYTSYKIDFKQQTNPQVAQFVSDGNAIYMKMNKDHYVKSESYGKYIYFRGRIPTNSDQTDINSTDKKKQPFANNTALMLGGSIIGVTAALLTGTGFIVYGTTANNKNTTNMTVKGVVINTETEEMKFVTDLYLYKITKSFPLMLKDYRKSRRKLEDKRDVIIKLNSKF